MHHVSLFDFPNFHHVISFFYLSIIFHPQKYKIKSSHSSLHFKIHAHILFNCRIIHRLSSLSLSLSLENLSFLRG